MKYLFSNFRIIFALAILVCQFGLTGCASKKAVVKTTEDGVVIDEEGALKAFKEGAEALYTDDQLALEKFLQAVRLNPEWPAAHYQAGVANENLDRLEDAEKNYVTCLAIKKDEPSCLENLLITKFNLNQIESADELLNTYLQEMANEPFVNVAAAKYWFLKNDLKNAEKFARLAIERDAENVEALYVMMRIFHAQKKYAAARYTAKTALELAPTHGEIFLWQGHNFVALKLLHDALESYEKAVKYQPSPEALESFGLLALQRGRVKDAVEALEKLALLRPNDYRNHLHLGNAYLAQKNFEKTKSEYELALELNKEDLEINFNLGLLYFDLKPEGMKPMDRFKKSQEYFTAFSKLKGVSKDRLKEANEYLKKLAEKIELEEFAQEEVAEEPFEEEEPSQEEPGESESEQDNTEQGAEAPQDESPQEAFEEESPKDSAPQEEPLEEKAPIKADPEIIDEEEEDFFDEFE